MLPHGLLRLCAAASLGATSFVAQACGPLQVVLHPYPGIYEPTPDGEGRGLDVDIVRELSKRTGCTMVSRPATAARAWPALVAGEVDMAGAVLYRPEREADVEYLGFARTRHMLLLRRGAVATATGPGFLADSTARLGVVKSAPFPARIQKWVDALREQGRVSESADMLALIKAHSAARIDAILIYPFALYGQSEEWLAQFQVVDAWPEEGVSGGIAVSRAAVPQPLRDRLREAMRGMIRDGTVARLATRHFGGTLGAHYSFSERP